MPKKTTTQKADNGVGQPDGAVNAAPSTPNTQEGIAPAAAVAPQPPDAAGVVGDDAQLSYRVISVLRHNGRRYEIGDLVELNGEQAVRLIGMRVVTDQAVAG